MDFSTQATVEVTLKSMQSWMNTAYALAQYRLVSPSRPGDEGAVQEQKAARQASYCASKIGENIQNTINHLAKLPANQPLTMDAKTMKDLEQYADSFTAKMYAGCTNKKDGRSIAPLHAAGAIWIYCVTASGAISRQISESAAPQPTAKKRHSLLAIFAR